jgi:hypothetical protein
MEDLMTTVDLTKLDDTQLATFAAVSSEFRDLVKQERRRRSLFTTMEDGLSALFEATLKLESVVETVKKTAATNAVRTTGIIDIAHRLLMTAEANGMKFSKNFIITATPSTASEDANAAKE